MKPKEFISKLEENRIVTAIAAAEKQTSGELRVWISDKARTNALAAAKERFVKLGMQKTKNRNAVLLYFAPASRQFAICGDIGVHEKCGDIFWKDIAGRMEHFLKAEQYNDAVEFALKEVGEVLARHFPRDPGDINELSDQIVRD
ncbi:MAG TPA: TPM domain-containing protein [Candidatus Saccharimonadales bacterium]|nr:TPM domain-containing protein [Candidatus Saccharimonadales bacterium]